MHQIARRVRDELSSAICGGCPVNDDIQKVVYPKTGIFAGTLSNRNAMLVVLVQAALVCTFSFIGRAQRLALIALSHVRLGRKCAYMFSSFYSNLKNENWYPKALYRLKETVLSTP